MEKVFEMVKKNHDQVVNLGNSNSKWMLKGTSVRVQASGVVCACVCATACVLFVCGYVFMSVCLCRVCMPCVWCVCVCGMCVLTTWIMLYFQLLSCLVHVLSLKLDTVPLMPSNTVVLCERSRSTCVWCVLCMNVAGHSACACVRERVRVQSALLLLV